MGPGQAQGQGEDQHEGSQAMAHLQQSWMGALPSLHHQIPGAQRPLPLTSHLHPLELPNASPDNHHSFLYGLSTQQQDFEA